MSTREALYLAALLQDVGTYLGRAETATMAWAETAMRESRRAGSDPGRALSTAFIREYSARLAFIPPLDQFPRFWDGGADEPGFRTTTDGLHVRLLRIAEMCALPELGGVSVRGEPLTSGARLQSPLAAVTLQRGDTRLGARAPSHLHMGPLSIERDALFPAAPEGSSAPEDYQAAVHAFLADCGRIGDAVGLLAILEKHLYAVPLHPRAPGVSLFDAARATAAIALCLHDEHAGGSWTGEDARIAAGQVESLPPPCLLVSGGLSGIQDFIFDVPGKRASKSLKGRSSFVQFAAEACVRHILDALDLRDASLLYSGGGNFLLLAPASRADSLEQARRTLSDALLPESLALALAWVPVAITDFTHGRFADRWRAAHARAEQRKWRRFQELGVRVFESFAQAPRSPEGDDDPFARLTERLSRHAAYEIERNAPPTGDRGDHLFARLGMGLRFTSERTDTTASAFNQTDFAGRFRDFRFAVKDLPRYTPELIDRLGTAADTRSQENRPGTLVDFEALARMAEQRTGTPNLGVLKMDVDNLGEIFVRGLPEAQRTITRMTALSRTMKWFFEAYLNQPLQRGTFSWVSRDPGEQREAFSLQLYPVFSGGDDMLLVGAWDAVFEFARQVRADFASFTGYNPAITLSAALLVIDHKEPVARFARRAGELLDLAKASGPEKDRVNVFGNTLTWAELEEAAGLKRRLEVLVKQRAESRAILHRIQRSATGYARLQDGAVHGRFQPERIWRLAYFLGRNARAENRAEIEQIAGTHEKLLLDAFTHPSRASNPALFVVAGRWAELACRTASRAASPSQRS